MGEPYGQLDGFRDPLALGEDEIRERIERLERRGQLPDEREFRSDYLGLLEVGAGQRVLDVGCGTGVVTREVARRVAPGGRAVGLDPSPPFLAHARAVADAEGLGDGIEFQLGSARAIPFPDGSFDRVIAVTALAHIPDAPRTIPELRRVTRPGGRVGIFDLDTDSLIVNHPDRVLTRRIVAAYSDHAAVDGWLARRLPGLLVEAGFRDVAVRAFTPLDQDPTGFYATTAERAAEVAVRMGAIDEGERQIWLAGLRNERSSGRFLAGRTHLFVWGTRPPEGSGG